MNIRNWETFHTDPNSKIKNLILILNIMYSTHGFYKNQRAQPKNRKIIFHYHNHHVHHYLKKIKLRNFFRN